MRDLPRLQDGRPSHLLHLAHVDQHEQTKDAEGKIGGLEEKTRVNFRYVHFRQLIDNDACDWSQILYLFY